MSHNPEQYGYHDEIKAARIARKVQKAMLQQDCSCTMTPAGRPASGHFHLDDCAGCQDFITCARQQEDFSAECWCPYCYWMGYWDDVRVKITPQTMQDPEERQYFCPLCNKEVEDVND